MSTRSAFLAISVCLPFSYSYEKSSREPTVRIELTTSPLPRVCSTTELHGPTPRDSTKRASSKFRLCGAQKLLGLECLIGQLEMGDQDPECIRGVGERLRLSSPRPERPFRQSSPTRVE